MEKIKIKTVFINDSKSDGTKYVDKNGNPFKIASISWEDGKASMIIGSRYGAKDEAVVKTWKPGDTVSVLIEQNGDFTNFKLPSKTDLLEIRIKKLEDAVFGKKNA